VRPATGPPQPRCDYDGKTGEQPVTKVSFVVDGATIAVRKLCPRHKRNALRAIRNLSFSGMDRA
jgi:hypothetical protein